MELNIVGRYKWWIKWDVETYSRDLLEALPTHLHLWTEGRTDGCRSRKYVIITGQVLRPYLTMYKYHTCSMPFVTSLKLFSPPQGFSLKKSKILTSVIVLLEMEKCIFPDTTHTFALILVGTNVSVLQSEREFAWSRTSGGRWHLRTFTVE